MAFPVPVVLDQTILEFISPGFGGRFFASGMHTLSNMMTFEHIRTDPKLISQDHINIERAPEVMEMPAGDTSVVFTSFKLKIPIVIFINDIPRYEYPVGSPGRVFLEVGRTGAVMKSLLKMTDNPTKKGAGGRRKRTRQNRRAAHKRSIKRKHSKK